MEVNRLVTETSLQLVPPIPELPPAAEGLEPLLTIDQLCSWTGYSRKTIYTLRNRSDDPLPTVGPASGPRAIPSEVIAWMRREAARSTEAA